MVGSEVVEVGQRLLGLFLLVQPGTDDRVTVIDLVPRRRVDDLLLGKAYFRAGPVVLPPADPTAPLPELLAALGLSGGLPERMATVNTLLNAVPPALRERLLIDFLSHLQRP